MLVLGIETSCDETAAALVTDAGEVRASVVASQMELHARFGGVVPELASRQHLQALPAVVEAVFRKSGCSWSGVQGIAATHGPGLMGALLVGLAWAKAAAWARGLPFVGVNHLEGHLKSVELNGAAVPRPFIGLVASGGHTNLYLVSEGTPKFRQLAGTRDDAVGEAFDKVAKLLGLDYPGGPAIEQAARAHPAPKTAFPQPKIKDGTLAFSYSGLKTAVRYFVEQARVQGTPVDAGEIAAAFQRTVITDVTGKTLAAASEHGARAVALTGGVAANRPLREALTRAAQAQGLVCVVPAREWCTDNAAMIAAVGAERLAAGQSDPLDLPAVPNLTLA